MVVGGVLCKGENEKAGQRKEQTPPQTQALEARTLPGILSAQTCLQQQSGKGTRATGPGAQPLTHCFRKTGQLGNLSPSSSTAGASAAWRITSRPGKEGSRRRGERQSEARARTARACTCACAPPMPLAQGDPGLDEQQAGAGLPA